MAQHQHPLNKWQIEEEKAIKEEDDIDLDDIDSIVFSNTDDMDLDIEDLVGDGGGSMPKHKPDPLSRPAYNYTKSSPKPGITVYEPKKTQQVFSTQKKEAEKRKSYKRPNPPSQTKYQQIQKVSE